MAKAAQDALAQLEKAGAPFAEQLEKAGKFAGIEWLDLLQTTISFPEDEEADEIFNFHGREEWALKWLTKKMQQPTPRQAAMSWRLLRCLVQKLPKMTSAKILNERKALTIVKQALGEIVATFDSSDKSAPSPAKANSKKRKRSGELVTNKNCTNEDMYDVAESIYEAVSAIERLSVDRSTVEDDAAFGSKYMKQVLVLPADEAANVLESWLKITNHSAVLKTASIHNDWLEPFLQVWDARTRNTADASRSFSKCLEQALVLLFSKLPSVPASWKDQLDKLISRDVVKPAQNEFSRTRDRDTTFLSSFICNIAVEKPELAVPFFKIAIRSTQLSTNLRNRTHSINWLQAVFKVLLEAGTLTQENGNKAVNEMLNLCHEHGISIDLELLRDIVSEFAFLNKDTDVDLVSAVVALSPQVFSFSEDRGKDLMTDLFNRITKYTSRNSESHVMLVVEVIISKVMVSSAHSRNLIEFLKAWYEQLVAVATNDQKVTAPTESVWEAQSLFDNLSRVMQLSLTSQQFSELCTWLKEKAEEEAVGPGPAMTIADAMSNHQWLIVNQPEDNFLWRLAVDKYDELLNTRWEHSIWNIMATAIRFSLAGSESAEEKLNEIQSHPSFFVEPVIAREEDARIASRLAWFNFAVAYHTLAYLHAQGKTGQTYQKLSMANAIEGVLETRFTRTTLKHYFDCLQTPPHLRTIKDDLFDSVPEYMDVALWKYEKLFDTLEVPREKQKYADKLPEFVTNIFWLASVAPDHLHDDGTPVNPTCGEIRRAWELMLEQERILNNKRIIRSLIQIMIECITHSNNPVMKSPFANGFAVKCLNKLPIEVFKKTQRESIMRLWVGEDMNKSPDQPPALVDEMEYFDPAIISLKMKMMEKPSLPGGLSGSDVRAICNAIYDAKMSRDIFVELTKRILGHLLSTVGQKRTDEIIQTELDFVCTPLSEMNMERYGVLSTFLFVELILNWWAANEERIGKVVKLSKDLTVAKVIEMQKKDLIQIVTVLIRKASELKKDINLLYSGLHVLEQPVFDVRPGQFRDLWQAAMNYADMIGKDVPEVAAKLRAFFLLDSPDSGSHGVNLTSVLENGRLDPSSSNGRAALKKAAVHFIANSTEARIRQCIYAVIPAADMDLGKMIMLSHLVKGVEDRANTEEEDRAKNVPSLARSYISLLNIVSVASDIRTFFLGTEIVAYVLRHWPRSMTQHCIESTLAVLCHIVARDGPELSPEAAGDIYLHLIEIADAILASHRLKLSGRSPLLSSLLCRLLAPLFPPLNTNKTWSSLAPSWLCDPSYTLSTPHAAAYARLITTLADPSTSAVSRGSKNPLVSATAKAKREAGSYLGNVIAWYVKLSLDMGVRMETGPREKIKQGIWTAFDAMGVEGRKVLGEGMDRAGRDVLRGLVEEWVRFGKWKGN